MELLRRKIDGFLEEWKRDPERLPLIVKGARQVGKTASICRFGKTHYPNFVEINFLLQKQYRDIFDSGFEVDAMRWMPSFAISRCTTPDSNLCRTRR